MACGRQPAGQHGAAALGGAIRRRRQFGEARVGEGLRTRPGTWPEAQGIVVAGTAPDRGRLAGSGRGRPGSRTGRSRSTLRKALASPLPVLVDADGLTVPSSSSTSGRAGAVTVITPHAGDWPGCCTAPTTRLRPTGSSPPGGLRPSSACTVLLKGSTACDRYLDAIEPVLAHRHGARRGRVGVMRCPATAGAGRTARQIGRWGGPCSLYGLAGRLTAPIGAADVLAAIPEAIRTGTASRTRAGTMTRSGGEPSYRPDSA